MDGVPGNEPVYLIYQNPYVWENPTTPKGPVMPKGAKSAGKKIVKSILESKRKRLEKFRTGPGENQKA